MAQTVGVRSVAIGGALPLDGMWTGQGIGTGRRPAEAGAKSQPRFLTT